MTDLYIKLASILVRPRSKKGSAIVEYALILAMIAIVVIAALALVGNRLKEVFSHMFPATIS